VAAAGGCGEGVRLLADVMGERCAPGGEVLQRGVRYREGYVGGCERDPAVRGQGVVGDSEVAVAGVGAGYT
jgi:hypothetical protein